MKLEILPDELSVVKLRDADQIKRDGSFYFAGRTDQEISLVCPTGDVPEDTLARDDGWRAFRICGELDFSLIGILSGIASILADAKIGIFAVSTYNTDYVLTKKEHFDRAVQVLKDKGYMFE